MGLSYLLWCAEDSIGSPLSHVSLLQSSCPTFCSMPPSCLVPCLPPPSLSTSHSIASTFPLLSLSRQPSPLQLLLAFTPLSGCQLPLTFFLLPFRCHSFFKLLLYLGPVLSFFLPHHLQFLVPLLHFSLFVVLYLLQVLCSHLLQFVFPLFLFFRSLLLYRFAFPLCLVSLFHSIPSLVFVDPYPPPPSSSWPFRSASDLAHRSLFFSPFLPPPSRLPSYSPICFSKDALLEKPHIGVTNHQCESRYIVPQDHSCTSQIRIASKLVSSITYVGEHD